MTMTNTLKISALVLALAAASASAGSLSAASYTMVNGNGQAAGSQKNYWDLCYGGVCDKSTDNQVLSGAVGDLTDGVVTPHNWWAVESASGTGPYVGWHRGHTTNVAIDFHFGSAVNVDQVSIHADDANGRGGVSLPASVTVSWTGGSRSFDVIDPVSDAPRWLSFAGLGISGVDSLRVQLTYRTGWMFIDEVAFDGAEVAGPSVQGGSVPEPSSATLAGLALFWGLLLRLRHRRAMAHSTWTRATP